MNILETARRHVREGRNVVERQRALIIRMRVQGLDPEFAICLLGQFERFIGKVRAGLGCYRSQVAAPVPFGIIPRPPTRLGRFQNGICGT
jgi:hypothetical protein